MTQLVAPSHIKDDASVDPMDRVLASSDSEGTVNGTIHAAVSQSKRGKVSPSSTPSTTPSIAGMKLALDRKLSFERGGKDGDVEEEEDVRVPNDMMDIDVDDTIDIGKDGIRFEQEGKSVGTSEGRRESAIKDLEVQGRRPSLPGIKELFGIAGSATIATDSSRPSTPSFPGLSSLHGPLVSRSSVSSISSGRLSRLSSFASTSGVERDSFSTSVGSGNVNSPGVVGGWKEDEDRKGSYGAGGGGDRLTMVRVRDENERRWSELNGGTPQAEEVRRSDRTQSYPFSGGSGMQPSTSSGSQPPVSPRRNVYPNGKSPLKWSTQPALGNHHGNLPSPISPTCANGQTSAPIQRFPSGDCSGAPSFVSPFGGAALHHPQPMLVRQIPSPSTSYLPMEANDRERTRWAATNGIGGHDPLSPRGNHPYPVQRSRSGQGSLPADRRNSSTSWRSHPYERESQRSSLSSLSRQRSRSPGPIMGPYAEQARRGSVQIAPDMLQGGGAYHWKGTEPLAKMGQPSSSSGPLDDRRWSSSMPMRTSISGTSAAREQPRRDSHSMGNAARLSPRSAPLSGLPRRTSDAPSADPSAFELEMQDKRRKSESEMGWREETSQPHWHPSWDHQRQPGSLHPYESIPSVLRPALPLSQVAPPGRPLSIGIPRPPYPDYDSQLPTRSSERAGQYQPIRVYPVNGMPTADLPRPLSSNENGPQGPGEHGTILNGPNGPRYICNFCAKQFTRPSSLRIHTYSHTGERPYICSWPNCGRSFSVQSNLKRHAKTHTLNQTGSTTAMPVAGISRLQRTEMTRRNSYDVPPTSQRSAYTTQDPSYHQPGHALLSGQPVGRMSLGSIMDHTAKSSSRASLHSPEIKVDEEEEAEVEEEDEEEDELADDADQELVKLEIQ